MGGRRNPIWRVVVADQRSPRDGRIIETVGRYNAQTNPSEIVLDADRLIHWLDRGAQPTSTVKKLMRTQGIGGIGGGAAGSGASGDTPTAPVDAEPGAGEQPAAGDTGAGAPEEGTAPPTADAEADPAAGEAVAAPDASETETAQPDEPEPPPPEGDAESPDST